MTPSDDTVIHIDPRDRLRPIRDKRQKQPRSPAKPPRKSGRSWLKRYLIWGMNIVIWASVAIAVILFYYSSDLPDLSQVTASTRRPSVQFISADGENFASYGDLYGEQVTVKNVARFLPQAIMATEDRRFFDHFGVDIVGLARAAVVNAQSGRVVQGGSTLTQQLAKNLFLTPERTFKRKLQEVLMALSLERHFSKEQIFNLYLNRVYLGAGTHGVDAAAHQYFGQSAKDLSLYQSALLAGLLKAPSRYNPRNDPEASHKRTLQVLANMVDAGYISEAEANEAAAAGPGSLRRFVPGGRYFSDWLYEQVGKYAGPEARDLVVTTTLDMALQRKAEAELQKILQANGAKQAVSQGAIILMTPDGAIRALVGGRDYDDSQFNRATQGLRQPGSAFKPFVYLAALEAGLRADDMIDDAPVKIGNWSPGNFTGKYEGPVTLRHALAKSTNTVAVRLTEYVGVQNVVSVAKRLGISSPLQADLSLALGTSEVNLLELTGAYAAFANGGYGVWSHGIARIEDARSREVIYDRTGDGPGRLIDQSHLVPLTDMMSAVIQEGTGRAAQTGRPSAGKTGTTQDYKDAWFIGFTADYVGGVWLGNDDSSPMKKVSGSTLPAQLWRSVMLDAHSGLPPRDLPGLSMPQDEPSQEQETAPLEELPWDGNGNGGLFKDLLKSLLGE